MKRILAILPLVLMRLVSTHAGEREDLEPVRSRWQFYPPQVRSVTVDRTGRPWFELRVASLPGIAALKARVEAVAGLERPWVAGAKVLLHDSKSRVWLVPHSDHKLLLGYNWEKKTWIERKGIRPGDRGGYDEKDRNTTAYLIDGPAHESVSGRLYFGDRIGVHVLDGEAWSHKNLYLTNIRENRYYGDIKSFNPVEFAEDVNGRVFVWSNWGTYGWSGTIGYFTHDADGWGNVTEIAGRGIERLQSVVPLAHGLVLVCPQSGLVVLQHPAKLSPATERQLAKDLALLGAAAFAERRAAEARLRTLGPVIRLRLAATLKNATDPEVTMRLRRLIARGRPGGDGAEPGIDGHILRNARSFLTGARGNTWLWADDCRTPANETVRSALWLVSRAGEVTRAPEATQGWHPDSAFVDRQGRVYFAGYRRGCEVFDQGKGRMVTDSSMTTYRYILGEDGDGRIYLSDERTVAAYWPGLQDRRKGLPTTVWDVPRGENSVCKDSKGTIWARLAGPDAGLVSAYGAEGWKRWPLPDDRKRVEKLLYCQPLREGMLVLQSESDRSAYFFDGTAWTVHDSMPQLVESHFGELSRTVDNRRFGRDFYTKMRVDRDGQVWLVEWTKCGVYDGRTWTDLAAGMKQVQPGFDSFTHCLPINRGERMLVTDGNPDHSAPFLARVEDGKAMVDRVRNPRGRIDSSYPTRSGLWIDSRDRVWLPGGWKRCTVIGDGRVRVVPDSGLPRFEDSFGSIWFLNPHKKALVVLNMATGNSTRVLEDALHDTSQIVEDRPGSFWIGTTRGLLHVVRERRKDGGVALRKVAHYEKDVPNGSCLQLFIDSAGALWFYGPGEPNYRLYRVELPKD